MDELKPCPFCGQDPDVLTGSSFVAVFCPRCGYEFDWPLSSDWRAEWNTRPAEEALQARITELEARLATLRIELDKADGAGQELMAENETLRTKLISAIAGFEYTLEMYKKLSDDLAAPALLAELEAARRVCFAIEKYIMMPTQDDNGLAVDDGAEWDAIIEALNEWKKAMGEE